MKIFEVPPKSPRVAELISAADEARDRKEWHEASIAYRKAVERDPTLKHIWVQLGHCEKESGRLAAAEAAYRKSVDIDPLVADTHLQLGHALKLQGKLAEAKASYERALEIDPRLGAAKTEVTALSELSVESSKSMPKTVEVARLVFECSDLTEYFVDNRLPTGIQRVQINIIQSSLTLNDFSRRIRIIFYSLEDQKWHEITALDFLSLINAAQQLQTVSDSAWHNIRSRICGAKTAPRFSFSEHDTLINIGTSWWIQDYFLRIRNLKDEYDLKYIPFVHDCIPLMTPEHCAENLTKEFESWIKGVFRHADYFLVNSNATKTDLLKFAAQYGQELPGVHVVQLDGNLNAVTESAQSEKNDRKRVAAIFESYDIVSRRSEPPRFVLFVSTLESRKNHLLAFMVWDKLIAKLGMENTPYLVCVGKQGWMFDSAAAYLRGRSKLQRRVKFLSGIDDLALSALYNECEFTVYPSFYEGWGLPVTESLCHGKTPVIANVSSLPEAGKDFAVYFDPAASRDAYDIIEKLILDKPYRERLEAKIKSQFRPRSWEDIATELLTASSQVKPKLPASEGEPSAWIEHIDPASLYSMAQIDEAGDGSVKPGVHMRLGEGWFTCESWGVWIGPGDARLAFVFSDKNCSEVSVYLRLKGAPGRGSTLEVGANFSDRVLAVFLGPEEVRWFSMVFPISVKQVKVKELIFHAHDLVDLAMLTNGNDKRRIGCGLCEFSVISRSDLAGRLAMMEYISIPSGRLV